MDTKLKADIAESAVTTQLLKRGFRVLRPVGDRLPYDLAIDNGEKLIRIQVKSAWGHKGVYNVDTRWTKTNRRKMLRTRYAANDFDFAILYVDDADVFYIMPQKVFDQYKSGIRLVEKKTRQREPKAHPYKNAWELLMGRSVRND